MAGSLKMRATPIVVDYQRERYIEAERLEGRADAVDDGHSALFYLSVWALSAGLFLSAFYVASEAPIRGERGERPEPAVAARPGLRMASARAPRAPTATALEPRAVARSENRR